MSRGSVIVKRFVFTTGVVSTLTSRETVLLVCDPSSTLNVTVRVAVLGLPRNAPPEGFRRLRFTVLLAPAKGSSTIGTVNVLIVSPAAKFNVPDLAM